MPIPEPFMRPSHWTTEYGWKNDRPYGLVVTVSPSFYTMNQQARDESFADLKRALEKFLDTVQRSMT